ncbi:melanotransferrin-like [Tubulanus polymorphus]|uniref:melanotransferrin-like n=1 Tax=Tubulanus polymorphus TaxID=672921 RepID=UPI003DA3E0E9
MIKFAFGCLLVVLVALTNQCDGQFGNRNPSTRKVVKWCVTVAEEGKCLEMKKFVQIYMVRFTLECIVVRNADRFTCMSLVRYRKADLVSLDAGEMVMAGRYFRLIPLMAERYGMETDLHAVMVARRDNPDVNKDTLKGKKICSPGMGWGAGWTLPVSQLLQMGIIEVKECNLHVESVANHFGSMCVPSVLSRYYNSYGMNPMKACELCSGKKENYCTSNDTFANYVGAFNCMASGTGDVAFLRAGIIEAIVGANGTTSPFRESDFVLLCPDGSRKDLNSYMSCNWGTVASQVLASTGPANDAHMADLKEFIIDLVGYFGPAGPYNNRFDLFASNWQGTLGNYTGNNLMLSDDATELVDVGSRSSYDKWVGPEYMKKLDVLEMCPIPRARWCVISEDEMKKCEMMTMAFKTRRIKPELSCILADSTQDCMKKIKDGDADLITLDAADIYNAGKYYDLVPIAAEDYGDGEAMQYAVAIVRKSNPDISIFNLKARRVCFSGVNMAAGWVIPVSTLIETNQILIRPDDCNLYDAIGEFFFKACAPGVLNERYKPDRYRINLCEACASGGSDKCQRNSRELYFGDSGSFRCLVEDGGDVSFTRHTVARDNTGGRNPDYWARNRRADDYELLCMDGTRGPIDDWRNCHLQQIKAPAVVTAGYKQPWERKILWKFLNYGQSFFASDGNKEFQMFDSGFDKYDLIFSDSAVRLVSIPPEMQNYKDYLGQQFMSVLKRINHFQCTTGYMVGGAKAITPIYALFHLVILAFSIIFLHW